ncbi:hypothetical protein [Fluviicola sp.]|uniref:hypothetical protein n=1 Tax=Fluviicola sp. TaxID=1917219 RepID=UPI0031E34E21
MRGLYLFLIVILIGSGGCEKWRLKQPASLNLSWKFYSTNSSQGNAVINKGYFYSKQFTVSGTRVKGDPVQITQDLFGDKIEFSVENDLGIALDVPMGDYTQFEIKTLIDKSNHPCIHLEGFVYKGAEAIPIVIEWSDYEDLSFKVQNPFYLERKKSYKVNIGFDINQLLSSIPSSIWNSPSYVNENGVPTLLINKDNNIQMFNKITEQLPNSLILTVE